MRIAVIGGGWAGIAAAVELTAERPRGHAVRSRTGAGWPGTQHQLDGRPLDNGQHILLGAYRDTLDLMRRVGVGSGKRVRPTTAAGHRPRRILPAFAQVAGPAQRRLGAAEQPAASAAGGKKYAPPGGWNASSASGFRLADDISGRRLAR